MKILVLSILFSSVFAFADENKLMVSCTPETASSETLRWNLWKYMKETYQYPPINDYFFQWRGEKASNDTLQYFNKEIYKKGFKSLKNNDKEFVMKSKRGNRFLPPFTEYKEEIRIDKATRKGTYHYYDRFIASEPTRYETEKFDVSFKDCTFY